MNINKEEYLQNLQASLKIVQSNVNAYFAKDGNADKTMDDYFASDDFYAIIDAVNIDWNGIEVSENKTINTTTELINWIKEIAASIPEQGGSQDEQGTPGQDGKSAYEIAQENGFEGTEEEWLESLKGEDGKSAYELYKEIISKEAKSAIYSFKSFGVDGDVPYGTGTVKVIDIDKVENSTTIEVLTNKPAGNTTPEQAEQFVGKQYIVHATELIKDQHYDLYSDSGLQTPIYVTVELVNEAEWLESLKGKDGKDGKDGVDGKDGSFDASALEGYATKQYVDNSIQTIVGTAPQNFDTLEELATVMEDLKVIDTPAQEATYYEEGDELPEGVQVGDEKTPAVEEVSHNMTISEFVNETMQSVNEKPEIAILTKRLSDLEKFVNRYVTLTPEQQQTVENDSTVTETLANATSVTIEEGTIADIVVPETTKSTTITGELDPNSTLELTSPKGVTINNTSNEPTNLAVNAPADGSTPTVTLKSGTYDTVTVQDASLTVSNEATIQNVVITPETTKTTTINATFVDGATVTSNSEAPITVTNKNAEGEEVSVTLNAPGSTVTLSGGKWTTISGEVSENTLIIKGSAKIQSLNLTKGNVIVEVPREEDIASVISGEITLGEGYTITHRQYDITNDNSSKLGGVGEMILQEDITRTSSIVAPVAPAYNAVWNLNGHNITVNGTPKSGVYLNRYSSNLEVKGTGVIHAEGSYGLWNSTTTGKIIVNDGVTIEAQTHVIYAEKGIIEINGGIFKLTNAATADKDANGNFKFLLNCYDANYTAGTANIIVKGGKFYGFDPSNTYGEPGGPVNYVAAGYESVPTNEAYEYGTVYEVRPIQS